MTWTISERELADGVELARQELDEYRDWDTLEVLARAVRWADQLAESRRLFGEAATDAVDAIAGHGEYAGDVCSRTAGYFALAGEPEQGREWAARAVADFREPRDSHGDRKPDDVLRRDAGFAIETLYVCALPEQALALAAETGIRNAAVELIEAERDRRADAIDAVVERLSRDLAAERVPPYDAYARYPVHAWDWLEFAFIARARVTGEPQPSHREMLERSGLLGGGASGRVVRLESGGIDRFNVPAADGTVVEATVDRAKRELRRDHARPAGRALPRGRPRLARWLQRRSLHRSRLEPPAGPAVPGHRLPRSDRGHSGLVRRRGRLRPRRHVGRAHAGGDHERPSRAGRVTFS